MNQSENDQFDKWLREQPGVYPTVWEIALARKAWHAAIESTVVKKERFGCHCNYPITFQISNYCALDDNDDKDHCHHASKLYDQGKTKANCPYWLPIEE